MNKSELDTPFVLIDLDKVERNIANMQRIATNAGISLRPHAKTHKIPALAHKQIQAGAIGVTVAKLGEAEVMVASGIRDILIAYPIIGTAKVERLIRLAKQVRISVAIDSYEAAIGISEAAARVDAHVGILIEMDCGFRRVGLPPGEPVVDLARRVMTLPGLELKGVLTFAGHSYDAKGEDELRRVSYEEGRLAAETAQMLRDNGIQVETVSTGSTPSAKYVSEVRGVTEIRPGTYIFGDLMQVKIGAHKLDLCALTVKVTVVSRPARNRAVIDAGTKLLTMDGEDSPIGTGRGFVVGHTGITVSWLTEEHGMLELADAEQSLAIGDTLEIVPVHCCGVINMVDEVAVLRGDRVEGIWSVAGRGKSR